MAVEADEAVILADEQVEDLWAEHDFLAAQRFVIDARIAEIDRAIVRSGEAKVLANAEMEGK